MAPPRSLRQAVGRTETAALQKRFIRTAVGNGWSTTSPPALEFRAPSPLHRFPWGLRLSTRFTTGAIRFTGAEQHKPAAVAIIAKQKCITGCIQRIRR